MLLVNDNLSWIASVVIGVITLYLVKFYLKVLSLPRGPIPLPFIGNILTFYGTKENQFVILNNLHKKYGPVFTFWMGTTPAVIIGDYELQKIAFNSKDNELMGRPNLVLRQFITQNKGQDVVFSDHGPVWASLRRVAHSAVRKLAVSDKLAYLVDDVVEQTVDNIKEKEGLGKPFDPKDYIYLMVYNIIASSAFGKRYTMDDEELHFFQNTFEYFRAHTNALAIVDRVPILKPFYYKEFKSVGDTMRNFSLNVRGKYLNRVKDHQPGVLRDFCDALIEAKEEAIAESKESAPHLNDHNLSLVILNLFFAGSDTTQYMLRWILLLMANSTQMQGKMRAEVDNNIGDRMATVDDIKSCPFVYAFINEALRFRGVAPMGVPHRALVDYKLGEYTIPANSFVFSNLLANGESRRLWSDPNQFQPNRFLAKDGTFDGSPKGFTPFGVGRRICLGEKLALNDLFLIIVRLLRSTSGQMFVLPEGDGSADFEPNPNVLLFSVPKPYKIQLKSFSS